MNHEQTTLCKHIDTESSEEEQPFSLPTVADLPTPKKAAEQIWTRSAYLRRRSQAFDPAQDRPKRSQRSAPARAAPCPERPARATCPYLVSLRGMLECEHR